MIVKVCWEKTGVGSKNGLYHTYEVSHYLVEIISWSGAIDTSTPRKIRLVLDDNKHNLLLSGGDIAFVMNNTGKTIEVIRTN